MSIFDFIKGLFGGDSNEKTNQNANVVEDKSANTYCPVGNTPSLENVARFVIQKGICKGADIQRHFQIGYKLSGSLMSRLQQKGIIDNTLNVLVNANISGQSEGQVPLIDCFRVQS